MANLLRHERSPYLLQHADNPVHWHGWNNAALQKARAENKPILLSIGYAACHWCHVMAHESFENAETAALMNRYFVNIKVDREERPDIDHLYMTALHLLGEQGGWPLTMFLKPDTAPFWGGTYFPPEPRWGRPSFRQVLLGIADAFEHHDEQLLGNAGALTRAFEKLAMGQPGDMPGPAQIDRVAKRLLHGTDTVLGGMQGAPKFPNAPIFRFLWSEYWRTGQADYAEAVHGLLRAMSLGGIYDHLGGGYARYSTDAEWLVPHFEKMLYDNAQILDLLALAHADRPDPLYAERAAETVAWLMRDMRCGDLFAASEDADSEGEEGRFYVWTAAEIEAVLGDAAPVFCAAYDVRPSGNWEGHSILRRITSRGSQEDVLAAARARLFAHRAMRIRPGRDDKILADWNGLLIAALVRAASVFEQPDWLAQAMRGFDALRDQMRQADARIHHAMRDGVVTAAGQLDDQACFIRAALALFEASGAPRYLKDAIETARATLDFFATGDGGFFMSARDATDLPAGRPRGTQDNAIPSGTGLMAEVFARLHHLTGDPAWRAHAEAVLAAHGGAGAGLAGMPTLLAAAALLENGRSVVIAGPEPDKAGFADVVLRASDPALCLIRAGDDLPPDHPGWGKPATPPAAYLCRVGLCGPALSDPAALRASLDRPGA